MDKKNDIRAGYRVPDDYFENFSARMALMASTRKPIIRRPVWKPIFMTASAVAAMLIIAFGIFMSTSTNSEDLLAEVPSDVIVTQFFGATESDVVDYYLTSDSQSDAVSDEDVLEYLSSSGGINLYALMDY